MCRSYWPHLHATKTSSTLCLLRHQKSPQLLKEQRSSPVPEHRRQVTTALTWGVSDAISCLRSSQPSCPLHPVTLRMKDHYPLPTGVSFISSLPRGQNQVFLSVGTWLRNRDRFFPRLWHYQGGWGPDRPIRGLFSGSSLWLCGKSGPTPVKLLSLSPPVFGRFAGVKVPQQDACQAR